MHGLMTALFRFLRSFWQFMKIIFVLLIILLLFYWVQNLLDENWEWLSFIIPSFKVLLSLSDKVYSASFNIFGAVFEFKYFTALVFLVILFSIMNLFIAATNIFEDVYNGIRRSCKKVEEKQLNKSLRAALVKEEKKISTYMILIHTAIKARYSHKELNVDIDEQNNLMKEFISNKLSVAPAAFNGGFLYMFDNFDKIDNVLDVMFKVLHSNAPLDYAICIQAGNNIPQLNKLAELKNFGKITMAADTAYRYRFNETHRYMTGQLGVFQYDERTLEVHEFKEIL